MKISTAKWITLIAFVGVILMNALANALPIAGRTTGDVSELYPNLFTPAGFAFSIWGVIYAGLLAYVIRVLTVKKGDEIAILRVTPWWVVNALANMAWILSWHYLYLYTSLLLMLVLLYSLIRITSKLAQVSSTSRDLKLARFVFDLYFGWITVATVANVTAVLIGVDWKGFGIAPELWMSLILGVIVIISVVTYIRSATVFYLVPVLWALYGIYSKHVVGFGGEYTSVIRSVQLAFAVIVVTIVFRIGRKVLFSS